MRILEKLQLQNTPGDSVRRETDAGIGTNEPFVQSDTIYEDREGWVHSTTTNSSRITIDPVTGKQTLSGGTKTCHALWFNTKDALCYGFKGSANKDSVTAGGGVGIKGGNISGGVYVVPRPASRSPRKWFGFEITENGKKKFFIRIPWKKGTALETSISAKSKRK